MSSFKNPPAFTDGKSYETWKNEIHMWQSLTELAKDKQALAISLSLSGRARDAAMEMDLADLSTDDGVDKLLTELDKLFLRNKVDLAYATYKAFDQFTKSSDMSMNDYVIGFEQRYNKAKKHVLTYTDAVLAFKLSTTQSWIRVAKQWFLQHAMMLNSKL